MEFQLRLLGVESTSIPLVEQVNGLINALVKHIPREVTAQFQINWAAQGMDRPWEPLEYKTKRGKGRKSSGTSTFPYIDVILVRSGRLKGSLSAPNAANGYFKSESPRRGDYNITLGTLVPYSQYHMEGWRTRRSFKRGGKRVVRERNVKARPHIGIARQRFNTFEVGVLQGIE